MASRKEIDRIDYLILNAGVSLYPNVGIGSILEARLMSIQRASEVYEIDLHIELLGLMCLSSSFNIFADHLKTNTIGPIITAQKLLDTRIPIRCIAFMSSDSASSSNFQHFSDG